MDNEKVKELEGLLDKATPSDYWEAYAQKIFRTPDDAPCRKWSVSNFLLMRQQRSGDARGFNQWKAVNRNVKKGAKAIYILAPIMIKIEKENKETGEKEDLCLNRGFRLLPVFSYADTEGEPLPGAPDISGWNVTRLCEALGVEVSVTPSANGEAGAYDPNTKKIRISIDNPQTLAHELSHYLDHTLNLTPVGRLNYDYALGELVAEGSAYAMAEALGFKPSEDKTAGYLKSWGSKDGKDAKEMFKKALPRIEAILEFVKKTLDSGIIQTKAS